MAAGSDVMSSAADMISAVDFSGTSFDAPDTGADLSDAAPLDDNGNGVEDLPLGDEPAETPAVEEPETPAETPAVDEPAVDPVVPDPAKPDLPDGVREATVNGKKEMRLTPQRYETFHQAHRTLRDFEGVIGEPVTAEGLDLRQRAYMGQERQYGDLLSGEPAAQAKVLSHFLDEAQRAFQEGEVGTDPTIPLGQAFYETLQQKAPDAYAHLRMRAGTDLINDMYAEGQRLAASGNLEAGKNLAISASHIAKTLGIGYKKDPEIAQFLATPPANADPLARLQSENQRLQEQLNGRQTTNAAEQFQSWHGNTKNAVTSGVLTEAVLPSLSAERKQWEQFPTQFENLVIAPLNKAVKQTIGQDAGFGERIRLAEQSARRASAQKRVEIAGQITQAYINRARLAVEAHKPAILREAAALLKQDNSATHQRREAAQNQRGPRGPQQPVPRSIAPSEAVNPGGVFNAKEESARLARLLG